MAHSRRNKRATKTHREEVHVPKEPHFDIADWRQRVKAMSPEALRRAPSERAAAARRVGEAITCLRGRACRISRRLKLTSIDCLRMESSSAKKAGRW